MQVSKGVPTYSVRNALSFFQTDELSASAVLLKKRIARESDLNSRFWKRYHIMVPRTVHSLGRTYNLNMTAWNRNLKTRI